MPVSFFARLDRTTVRPGERTRAHLVLDLHATGAAVEAERPPSRTILALDVSSSMSGEPIDQVVRSVDRLVEALRPVDEVGVVAFSDAATCVVEPVRVDAAGKKLVRSRVARLVASGRTNVQGAIELAAKMVAERKDDALARRAVILLSDGAPNVGEHTPDGLREIVKRHRAVTTFFALGYGVDHNEDVLAAIGAAGGGYEFVQDPATCARAFARALGAQADVVASSVEIVLVPKPGVELGKFVAREDTRFGSEGLVVSVADLVANARRVVVCEVDIAAPEQDKFLVDVAGVNLRWREPGKPDAASLESDVTIEVADRASELDPLVHRDVLLARADRARDEARALADRGNFAAAAVALRALLQEIGCAPGFVANDGSILAEAYEQIVDDAMAMERKPSTEEYGAYRKAQIGSKLAQNVPEGAKKRGATSTKLLEHTAGNYPGAALVILSGPGVGQRVRLGDECVIGRSADADLVVVSNAVSRRHAEVFALEGSFFVADLGSTNPTIVNGKALGRTPHKLEVCDLVRIGDVEIRYEET